MVFKKYIVAIIFLSLYLSSISSIYASSCIPPQAPECYEQVPVYTNIGYQNDGALLLTDGQVILPDGFTIVKNPTKQIKTFCATTPTSYISAYATYQNCVAVESSQNYTSKCTVPMLSGCTTQNQVGAMAMQQNLNGMGNAASGQGAVQACQDQVNAYQAGMKNYNTCVTEEATNEINTPPVQPIPNIEPTVVVCPSNFTYQDRKSLYENQYAELNKQFEDITVTYQNGESLLTGNIQTMVNNLSQIKTLDTKYKIQIDPINRKIEYVSKMMDCPITITPTPPSTKEDALLTSNYTSDNNPDVAPVLPMAKLNSSISLKNKTTAKISNSTSTKILSQTSTIKTELPSFVSSTSDVIAIHNVKKENVVHSWYKKIWNFFIGFFR